MATGDEGQVYADLAICLERIVQRDAQVRAWDEVGLLREYPVIVTPPASGAAPEGVASTGDPVMNLPWLLS